LDETLPDFVNMQDPGNYKYLQDQGLAKNMGEILNSIEKPSEKRVHEIYEDIEKKFTSTLVCLHFYLFVGLL
jgi:hypothetical protein